MTATIVERPVFPESQTSTQEPVHLREGRALPAVAACTLRPAREVTEDPTKVDCPKCISIQLDRLGLAYGA